MLLKTTTMIAIFRSANHPITGLVGGGIVWATVGAAKGGSMVAGDSQWRRFRFPAR